MNVPDTRRLIFSYLRKEPKLSCHQCKRVLVWDKSVTNYHKKSLEKNYMAFFCNKCYYKDSYFDFDFIFIIIFNIVICYLIYLIFDSLNN